MSKYMANSQGWGRWRRASTSLVVLYQIQVSITSGVKTSPRSRKSWSLAQAVQGLFQRPRRCGHACSSSGQVVDVLVQRLARIDLVLDAVDRRHQHGREGEVRIAGRIGAAELEPLGLGARAVHGNADGRRAVALRVGQIDRGLEAGHQPLVAVGRRAAEGEERGGVLEDAADGVERHRRSSRRSRCRRTAARRSSRAKCAVCMPEPLSPDAAWA